MATGEIWQVKLPDNKFYDIKDKWAREQIAGGIKFVIAWNGESKPEPAKIPAGVKVKYGDTEYTGTLAASADTVAKFYLVAKFNKDASKIYMEYITINNGTDAAPSYVWEKLGDTTIDFSDLGALAYKDSVTLNKGDKIVALTSGSTFTASDSNVSFSGGQTAELISSAATIGVQMTNNVGYLTASASGTAVAADGTAAAITGFGTHTTDNALGESTAFTTTVTPSTTYLKASSSDVAVAADGTAAAITGFGTHTTDNALGTDAAFTTTVTPSTSKLSATAKDAALGTASDTFVKSYPGVTSKMVKAEAHDTPILNASYLQTVEVIPSVSSSSSNMVTTSIPNVTGNADITVPQVTSNAQSSFYGFANNTSTPATKSTWTFTYSEGALVIGGANGTDISLTQYTATNTVFGTDATASRVTLGTAITAATGALSSDGAGASIVNGVTVGSAIRVASGKVAATADTGEGAAVGTSLTAGTVFNYATGALSSDGAGASVMTGLGTASTASALTTAYVSAQPTITIASGENGDVTVATGITSASTTVSNSDAVVAITALGTPTTATALTGVKVTAQPTITLASAATGDVSVATGIASASTTAGTGDIVKSITALGTPTTANALTGVQVTAQPTITLASAATAGEGSISYMYNASAVASFTDKAIAYAYTNLGTATAAAQTITIGGTGAYVAGYDALSITVS